ncbi:hypothetical protein RFI_18772 [Reticulomyxa filosa]|uniref:Uncharacterized protein n=1 Tax=Reticulomyxa filosa TaxID=46433 RepID=X6MWW5_RETFI|nr:hypothetical protein RFI_18772 [Reticulomyxa filosa]|eukprot:ETO18493.1 hypothetical protein RFI_18772 [Reticulomyxa filosa]
MARCGTVIKLFSNIFTLPKQFACVKNKTSVFALLKFFRNVVEGTLKSKNQIYIFIICSKMLFFVLDLAFRRASVEFVFYVSCLLYLVFPLSFGFMFAEVASLAPEATFYQCLYLTGTMYFESTFNYLQEEKMRNKKHLQIDFRWIRIYDIAFFVQPDRKTDLSWNIYR